MFLATMAYLYARVMNRNTTTYDASKIPSDHPKSDCVATRFGDEVDTIAGVVDRFV